MNSLTAARLMLTELESQLRDPVDLREAKQTAAALERHLTSAYAESIGAQGFSAAMPVLRAIDSILVPAPR